MSTTFQQNVVLSPYVWQIQFLTFKGSLCAPPVIMWTFIQIIVWCGILFFICPYQVTWDYFIIGRYIFIYQFLFIQFFCEIFWNIIFEKLLCMRMNWLKRGYLCRVFANTFLFKFYILPIAGYDLGPTLSI